MNLKPDNKCEKRSDIVFRPEIITNSYVVRKPKFHADLYFWTFIYSGFCVKLWYFIL